MFVSSVMTIIPGFKIRCKADTMCFANKCMCKGSTYVIKVAENKQIILSKDESGHVHVDCRIGDLSNPFNPSMRMASTERPWVYQINVYDCIWKYRKYINKKWLS